MAEAVKFKAPAKVNLRLEVLGKRKDSYHLLRMINTLVSLHDDVSLSLNRSGMIEVSCGHPLVPCGMDNIACRAADAILEKIKDKGTGVHILLRKRIPVAAGLGGGSSDAAAVLVGMCEAMNLKVSEKELEKIALKLGADVPFFIKGKPALVTGIGEEIEPIENFPDWAYLLVTPDFQVSTAWAYKKFKLKKKKNIASRDELLEKLNNKKNDQGFFVNDLEGVVVKKHPVISELKTRLLDLGGLGSVMSGSGLTVVGVYEDMKDARKAKALINKKYPGFFCEATSGVNAGQA